VRNHEHLGVIKPHDNVLVLNQLRYDSEIINPKGLNIPKKESIPKKELEIALDLIDQLTKPFKPRDYSDTYTDEIKEVIAKKAKGKKVTIKKGQIPKATKVHDIMSLLKESLEQHKKKPKRRKAA
jgi:DNA end-binding protein Ku